MRCVLRSFSHPGPFQVVSDWDFCERIPVDVCRVVHDVVEHSSLLENVRVHNVARSNGGRGVRKTSPQSQLPCLIGGTFQLMVDRRKEAYWSGSVEQLVL